MGEYSACRSINRYIAAAAADFFRCRAGASWEKDRRSQLCSGWLRLSLALYRWVGPKATVQAAIRKSDAIAPERVQLEYISMCSIYIERGREIHRFELVRAMQLTGVPVIRESF